MRDYIVCLRAILSKFAAHVLIASECVKTIAPYNGKESRLADGKSVPILDHVELPFDVTGVRRYIDVIIVDELEADCLLGADFMRKFNAILRSRMATLSIEGEKERIPLQQSSLEEDRAGAIHLLVEWLSPFVMHRKLNVKYGFSIDFRKLNAITKACA